MAVYQHGDGHARLQEKVHAGLPLEAFDKTYGIYNTGNGYNATVHRGDADGPCLYYTASGSSKTSRTSDVEVHAESENGPTVAFAKFSKLSGDITISLSDPDVIENSSAISDHKMQKDSPISQKEWMFESAAEPGEKPRIYIWRRIQGKALNADYECLDASSGEVIACFRKAGSMSKKIGDLCSNVESSTDSLDLLLLLSLLALREKEKRRSWYTNWQLGMSTVMPS